MAKIFPGEFQRFPLEFHAKYRSHILKDTIFMQHWNFKSSNRKWQDYVYIQCEYKSTKQEIKHLLREENKVKENKIS